MRCDVVVVVVVGCFCDVLFDVFVMRRVVFYCFFCVMLFGAV